MWEKLKKKQLQKRNKIQIAIFFCLLIICIMVIICEKCIIPDSNKNIRHDLVTVYESVENESKEIQKSTKLKKLEELQQINSDIIGIIQIEGTNINYPVLQTNNNEYYMTHNYLKEKSSDGALFLDKDYNWEIPSTNLLIYGHNNIGSKEMFADLIKYKSKTFYNSHKTINFTTNAHDATYEIFSVFLSKVYYKKQNDVFKYYFFLNANNEEEYMEYIKNCEKYSLYDTGVDVKYEDMIMTLSTCEYSRLNGRLVVVAKRVNE